jgi:hypothetical protein
MNASPGSQLSRTALVAWIRRRIDAHEPAAVVRFADGEAKLLTAQLDDEDSLEPSLRALKRETGISYSPAAAIQIKALVAFAFDGADVLGINYFPNFSAESKGWLDWLAQHYADRVAAGRRPPAALAPCLPDWDPLPKLLGGRRISVISCRDLKSVLETTWGVKDVAVYQVPSQYVRRDVDGDYERAMHDMPIWPDTHRRVCSELRVREPGEVFLVGAGLFGKDLCVRVRDHGGIALDMGSALDRLAGKVTRGPMRRALELSTSGMSIAEIAEDFTRLYGLTVSPARVEEILSSARERTG